jgi:hypothetical protein
MEPHPPTDREIPARRDNLTSTTLRQSPSILTFLIRYAISHSSGHPTVLDEAGRSPFQTQSIFKTVEVPGIKLATSWIIIIIIIIIVTPWLMEYVGSIPHSQGLSNNPHPESNQPNSSHWHSPIQDPLQYCPPIYAQALPKVSLLSMYLSTFRKHSYPLLFYNIIIINNLNLWLMEP